MTAADPHTASLSPFQSIIAAIDGSPESIEAASQGRKIAPGLPITLVYIIDTAEASSRVPQFPAWAHTARQTATDLLEAARRHLEPLDPHNRIDTAIEEGQLLDGLRYITNSRPDALLTLGPYEQQRTEPLPIPGSEGQGRPDWVIRTVACSVLVAKAGTDTARFPRSIVVGVDGSEPSIRAFKVAATIAAQTATQLTVITALGGKGPDLKALHDASPHIPIDRIDPGHPVNALSAAADRDDLIVVGNRGLHGLRALGSISARLANRSPAPVLVAHHHTTTKNNPL